MKIAVASVSSQLFLPYVCALARSVRHNSPNVYMRIHLINPTDAGILEAQRAIGKGGVTVERVPLAEEEVAAYCSNSRIRITRDEFSKSYDVVINMDADAIVRGDLTQALSGAMDGKDVLLYKQSRLKVQDPGEKLYFLACMSIFCNTPNAGAFLDAWQVELTPMGRLWFGDQIALYRAFKKTEHTVRLGDLPTTLLDTRFSLNSVVWMAKGQKKYASAMYALELEKYSGRAISPVNRLYISFMQVLLRAVSLVHESRIRIITFLVSVRDVLSVKKQK